MLSPGTRATKPGIRALCVTVSAVVCLGPARTTADLGAWTPAPDPDLGGVAVHMALLHGDDTYHSRVVWWRKQSIGGVLGWVPGNDDCSQDPLTTLSTLGTWAPGEDIFCSGHAGLADGTLFTAGGNEGDHLYGINDARIFTPGSGEVPGTWTPRTKMSFRRWYPTATTLGNGRILVASGYRYHQLWLFGGRRDGNPPQSGSGDLVQRFGTASGGQWDAAVLPDADNGLRPVQAEGGASAFLSDVQQQMFFGGRDASGNALPLDAWGLSRNPGAVTDAEYGYAWSQLQVSGTLFPPSRSHHTAVAISATEIVIFGGLAGVAGSETVLDDLWRLYKDPQTGQWKWGIIIVNSGTPPTARYGHAAVYDPVNNRMILFGGAEGFGQAPTDDRMWEFAFDPSGGSGSWTSTVPTAGPAPRLNHTMAMRPGSAGSMLLYGGDLGAGTYSSELWELRTPAPGVFFCDPVMLSGSAPGSRARHSAVWNDVQKSLFVFGGDQAPQTPADDYVYVAQLGGAASWSRWAQAGFNLSGQTALIDPYEHVFARTPEIFDPITNSWSIDPVASLLQGFYPPHFVVPGAATPGYTRVVSVGGSPQVYRIDIPPTGAPTEPWQAMTANSGFSAQTGVQYEPGKVLIAGGQSSGTVVGTTKRLEATNPAANWIDLDDMAPRYNHNLVLLPTGEVLALGGVGTTVAGGTTNPVKRPQLRYPESGTWSSLTDPATRLAEDRLIRDYHSTAILLPDGRILCAGGDGTNDQTLANVFCPPYLFKADGTPIAVRPQIQGAPGSLGWGETFTVCTPLPNEITRVAMLRPAATTHAFDQNQRYVPLSFTAASNPSRLLVTSPASPDSAPPGYYLLFLTGSADGPDVPSIATWIRLGDSPGRDTCDTVVPIERKLYVDLVSSNSVGVSWQAPADDDAISISGRVKSYDIRRNWGPINEANWASSTQATGEPPPLAPGEWETAQVSGLAPCTVYYFAVKSTDDNLQFSALGDTTSGRTWCGGGGGLALQRAPTGLASADAAMDREATSTALRPIGGTIVVERQQVAGNRWEVVISRVTDTAGIDLAEGPGVILQNADGRGGWTTTGQFDAGLDDEVAIASLRADSRVVFLGNWLLGRIAAKGGGAAGTLGLTKATLSGQGDVTASVVGSGVDLLDGDVLTVAYETTVATGTEEGWFVTVAPGGSGGATRREPGTRELPAAFALHQNEPNPFYGTTSIRFDLPQASYVRLEVFDLLGRRVAMLADREYPAGYHAVRWSHPSAQRRLTPGMYVYRIFAGGQRAERKMMLIP